MKHVPTLDEWVENNAEDLSENIATHLDVWEVNDPEALLRMIMISVRNWHEDQSK